MKSVQLLFLCLVAGLLSPAITVAQKASIVKNIYPLSGSSTFGYLFQYTSLVVGDELLFAADNSTNGSELWKSDGTDAGTFMLKDILPGDRTMSSQPGSFFKHNNEAIFSTNVKGGYAMWKSDGTEKGTIQIWDAGYGTGAAMPRIQIDTSLYLVTGGGLIRKNTKDFGYKTVLDPKFNPNTFGISESYQIARFEKQWLYTQSKYEGVGGGGGLYISDETKEGTHEILKTSGTSAIAYVPSKKLAFFFNDDGTYGNELWKTDGTTKGTSMVKDIAPGGLSSPGGFSSSLFPVTNGVVFTADNGTTGTELWTSDGTESGTRLLKEFGEGSRGAFYYFFRFRDDAKLYFTVDNKEFWCTDGTDAGTFMLVRATFSIPNLVQKFGNYFYYLETSVIGAYDYAEHWIIRADGKPNSSINLGTLKNCTSAPYFQVAGNNLFYIGSDDETGQELWKFPLCEHTAKINSPNGNTFCPGSSLSISAEGAGSNSGYTYQWKSGTENLGTNSNLTVTKAGIYTVEISSNGCTVSSSTEIKETTNLPVTITGSDSFCAGQSTTLKADATGGVAPYTYQWKLNNANAGTGVESLSANVSGVYGVVVTDSKGCAGTSLNKLITSKPSPDVTITASGAKEFVTGGSVVLSVPSAAGQSYQWLKNDNVIAGATNYSYTVNEEGTFKITVTGNGCSATSEPAIISLILGNEPALNEGFELTASPNPTSGEALVNFRLPKPGKVKVSVYDISGRLILLRDSFSFSKEHNISLSLQHISAGTYVIKGEDVNSSKTLIIKILKK